MLGGLHAKTLTTVEALGNPTGFLLTPGQAHDLQGTDVLLKETSTRTLIADMAYDAHARLVDPLMSKGKAAVFLLGGTRKQP